MLRKLPFLLALLLLPGQASALPPVDADGAFQHLATLHIAKTSRPFPLQGPVRLFGSAVDGHGGALLLGDGEALHVDGQGRLDRARFGAKVLPMLIFGNAVYDGQRLTWCDAQAKGLQVLDAGGQKQTLLNPNGFDVSGACQLYRTGQGTTALQAFPYLAWQFDAKGQVQSKLALEFPIRKPGSAVRPCGTDEQGTPLGALAPHEGHDLALVQLGPGLLPGKVVWTLDYAGLSLAEAVKSLRLQTANGCTMGAGRAAFWTHNQVLVFHGNALESWIRGSDKVDANNPHPSVGLGPYASQILGPVHLLGSEAHPLLLTAERDQGDLKLFGPAEALAEPRSPIAQVERRLDAGWWEDAAQHAQELLQGAAQPPAVAERLTALRAKARSLLRIRWTERALGPQFGPIPGQPDLLATYLQEAEQDCTLAPTEPLVHLAAARLARLAGRHALFLQHLEPLAAMLKAGHLKAAEVPDLFDLLAARGDTEGLGKFVAALDPHRTDAQALRWRATLLRLQGRFDEALKLLGDPDDDQPALLALRARLQVDAGDAQGAILTWTRALRDGLETDAQAHAGLGIACLRRGLNELAVQALNKAVSLDPDDAAVRSNLASAYAALDKKDDALQQLFGALAKNPKDPLLRWQLEQASGAGRPPAAKASAQTVAILPLQTSGGSTQRVGLGDFAATLLTTALVEGTEVAVVERARLDALLAEQKLGRSSHVDHATAAKLGRLLGARQVILGNVAEFDGSVGLDLRLVDVQTGRVVQASHATAALDLEAMRKALADAGKSLFLPR